MSSTAPDHRRGANDAFWIRRVERADARARTSAEQLRMLCSPHPAQAASAAGAALLRQVRERP